MAASVTLPLNFAWRQMKLVCFKPFNLGKWFVLGFCAWLAYLGEGGGNFNGGNFSNRSSSSRPMGGGFPGPTNEFQQAVHQAGAWLREYLVIVIVLGVLAALLLLALGLLVTWLRARGKFMFLDGVVKNRAAVAEPWRQFKQLANSLFFFTAVYGLIMMVVIVVILALGLGLAWHDLWTQHFGVGAVAALLMAIPLLLIVVLAGVIIGLLLKDFVVPIMYHGNLRTLAAWGVLRREILPGNVGNIVLFYLLRLVLGLAIGMATMAAICCTCCLAACVFVIPYVGTVALLPVLVFQRAWSVFMLGELNPAWRILRDPDEGKCSRCGYDLRGSTERCPECGTPIPPGQAPAGPVDPYGPPPVAGPGPTGPPPMAPPGTY